jgi:hypothetical protein
MSDGQFVNGADRDVMRVVLRGEVFRGSRVTRVEQVVGGEEFGERVRGGDRGTRG